MRAMILNKICRLNETRTPLQPADLPIPEPGTGEILIRVGACGVCHTELDEIEGRMPPPHLPVVLGHQAVGRVVRFGAQAPRFCLEDRVGVAWIYHADQTCHFCRAGLENLCPEFRATGRDVNGGYAEYMIVHQDFAHPIPDFFSDSQAAPLLCAGAIGYRSLKLTGLQDGEPLGLAGFGASAHLVLKLAQGLYPRSPLYVFARSDQERAFALELGAAWSGRHEDASPVKLRAIIDTTPVWKPVLEALRNLEPGGRLVVNAIRKEEADKAALLTLDYPSHLWLEKEIKSVANVTRADVREFLDLAARLILKPEVQEYPLEEANTALMELKERKIRGAKVLVINREP
jgi:propanol-preferring alcohol dehydrogenase